MIDTLRHSAIYNPELYKDKRVAIIGVGTIGSHLALTLARMQVPITLYDNDTIEAHNLATQSYTRHDIGKKKVYAVKAQCDAIGTEMEMVEAVPELFTATSADIIVSCVDSIEARREIARAIIETDIVLDNWRPIHDGRIGGEQVEVYRYANAKEWLDDLPEQADTDPCGARFTAYTANIAAGLLANNIKRELIGQSVQKRILYDAVSSSYIKDRPATHALDADDALDIAKRVNADER